VTNPQLGDTEIDEIIAKDLTRGQIKVRFGVGEHAAQLARTQAMAVQRERRRADYRADYRAGGLDMNGLRAAAEEYLEQRLSAHGLSLGTDRTKVTMFLDWLAEQAAI
jgi:hypothetical protein